jgi:hypothetical protein
MSGKEDNQNLIERRDILTRNSIRLARFLCLTVVFITTSAIVGWSFDFLILASLIPGLPAMLPNTILCFLILLLAIFGPRPLQLPSAILVLGIGLLFLAEYFFRLDFGIDRLLVQHRNLGDFAYPGRPAPQTAANFVLMGLAAASLSLERFPVSDEHCLMRTIAKGLVEAHRGKIECRSHEGVGSTFSFSIPITDSYRQAVGA